MARRINLLLLLVALIGILGCSRYDYYPRGIHHSERSEEPIRDSSVYTVKKDDTLYSIGKRSGVDYHILAQRNGIRPPYILYIGQQIYLEGYAPNISSHKKSASVKQTTSGKPAKTTKSTVKHPVAKYASINLIWPASGNVTSRFGPRNSRMHDGIDIGADTGAEIKAAAAGKVVYADSRLSGYGNLIIIRHNTEMFTAYAHNKKNLVKRGDMVKTGDLIGYVGSTGRASGPHLHFEVRRGETAVDPLAYLPPR